MRVTRATPKGPAAILARLFTAGGNGLPLPLARHLLKLEFTPDDLARMHELAEKNQQGQLSAEERNELEDYVTAADLLSLLQSQARKKLGAKAGGNRHG
jgi:hypothetical protein